VRAISFFASILNPFLIEVQKTNHRIQKPALRAPGLKTIAGVFAFPAGLATVDRLLAKLRVIAFAAVMPGVAEKSF